MFKYSYDSLVYYGEDVEKSIKRVAKYGYDALELVGEPDDYDVKGVNRQCKDNGIVISSICSLYTTERDLASPDAGVMSVADLAAGVGAGVRIVAPTAFGKGGGWKDPEEERKWAIDGIRESGEYAAGIGVKLCIEAWNRYETYMVNRLEQCLELMREVDLPNVGVMGDTFHMNIEEESIEGAFRAAGKDLIHVHIADSTRAAPSKGHIDFIPVLEALRDIGYEGYLSFELLPASADVFGVMERGGGQEFFDEYTKLAIEHMKKLEKSL
jgi:sugar phosphate isomerase/epimerase